MLESELRFKSYKGLKLQILNIIKNNLDQLRHGPNHNYKKLISDQNKKLWGIKYNFEKVQGCFCKIAELRGFSRNLRTIFLKKIPWKRSTGL
jgi:hypothetical protein